MSEGVPVEPRLMPSPQLLRSSGHTVVEGVQHFASPVAARAGLVERRTPHGPHMLPQYRVPARPTVRRRLWRRVLPQCLLVLSTQHLVLAVLIMFAGNVWRQDKASFWIDALSVALLADVFYTGCAQEGA